MDNDRLAIVLSCWDKLTPSEQRMLELVGITNKEAGKDEIRRP